VSTYYELDLVGNVRRLRSANGNDLGGYRYTAFGTAFPADTVTPAASISQSLQWKGRWFEGAAGGAYDVRARWWSPVTGTFLNLDEYEYHDPTSSLWGWPGQNPARLRDPRGRDAVDCAVALGQEAVICFGAGVDPWLIPACLAAEQNAAQACNGGGTSPPPPPPPTCEPQAGLICFCKNGSTYKTSSCSKCEKYCGYGEVADCRQSR
jgi:RHS repeat-associated protein